MYKYEDGRYYNAGENAFHRWGKKAQERVKNRMKPNKNGYYGIEVDGEKYWTIGTSKGKYGEFAKIGDTIFSVNSAGIMWAKEGTEKGERFVKALEGMLKSMQDKKEEQYMDEDDEDDEDEN